MGRGRPRARDGSRRALRRDDRVLHRAPGRRSDRELRAGVLEPHGGDLGGFLFIRGDAAQLSALRVDEEFGSYIQKATLIADGVGVVGATMGAALERQTKAYMEAIAQFA